MDRDEGANQVGAVIDPAIDDVGREGVGDRDDGGGVGNDGKVADAGGGRRIAGIVGDGLNGVVSDGENRRYRLEGAAKGSSCVIQIQSAVDQELHAGNRPERASGHVQIAGLDNLRAICRRQQHDADRVVVVEQFKANIIHQIGAVGARIGVVISPKQIKSAARRP